MFYIKHAPLTMCIFLMSVSGSVQSLPPFRNAFLENPEEYETHKKSASGSIQSSTPSESVSESPLWTILSTSDKHVTAKDDTGAIHHIKIKEGQ